MRRWASGKTRKDHIKNEDNFLSQKQLRWYVQPRKEGEDTTKKMINMQVPVKRRTGGPRTLDNIRDVMKEYNMTEDIVHNRGVWHMKTKADPLLHRGGL